MPKTFVFTDIHGNKKLYDAIIQYCLDADPNCTIVFAGDACDRGEEGYDIMVDLLSRKNIIYLKGNHEDLFVKAARSYRRLCEEEDRPFTYSFDIKNIISHFLFLDHDFALQIANGGVSTLISWIMHGCDMHFVNQIDNLPLIYSSDNLDVCHAGGHYDNFQNILEGNFNNIDIKNVIWDRVFFRHGWKTGRLGVHGHTPVFYLPRQYHKFTSNTSAQDIRPVLYYGKDKKYAGPKLDLDVCTVLTGAAFLFDYENKELIEFYDDKIINKDSNKEVQIIHKYNLEV